MSEAKSGGGVRIIGSDGDSSQDEEEVIEEDEDM